MLNALACLLCLKFAGIIGASLVMYIGSTASIGTLQLFKNLVTQSFSINACGNWIVISLI